MGIPTLGARKKILLGAAELAAGPAPGADLADPDPECWDGHAAQLVAADRGPGDAAAAPVGGSYGAAACGSTGEGSGGGSGGSSSGVGDWRALSGMGGAALFCGNIRRYFQRDPR